MWADELGFPKCADLIGFSICFPWGKLQHTPRWTLLRGPHQCVLRHQHNVCRSQRPSEHSSASPSLPAPLDQANFEGVWVSASLLKQSVWLKQTHGHPDASAGVRSSCGVHGASLVPTGASARAEACPGWQALHGAGGTGAASVCPCKVTAEPNFWTCWLSQEGMMCSHVEYGASCELLFSETRVLLTGWKIVNNTSLWFSAKISYVRPVEDFLTGKTMSLWTEAQRNAEGPPSLKAYRNNLTNIFASSLDIIDAFHQRIRLD